MRIVVLHAGGLGDLVLAETLFSALRERHPGARLELACRNDVAPVAELYETPPDAVHAFPFNPYRWDVPNDLVVANVRALTARIGAGVDLLISAELLATWLGDALAATLEARDALIGDPTSVRPSDGAHALLQTMRIYPNASVRRIETIAEEHELDRYARLAGTSARRMPALARVGASDTERKWIAVFPLGATSLAHWPFERVAAAATSAARSRDAGIILIGSHAESAELIRLAALFDEPPEIRTGTVADLPAIARTIAGACGYIGIDSGLAHLAAAYGIPGVTVYGGGTWPAYAPWAPSSAGVLAPIPCSGCGWDCAFERAFCVEAVEADAVATAFETVQRGAGTEPLQMKIDAFGDREHAIFAAAGAVYRAAQADRAARFRAITRLRGLLARYGRRAQRLRRRDIATIERLQHATKQAATILGTLKDGT